MKNIQTFFLAIIISAFCHTQTPEFNVSNNNPIVQIAKNYFRSNPYTLRFSTFLNHLINDPTLSDKTIIKRTDTTFFFFKGVYNNHNPFSFKADRTEIRLAEREVELGDSLSTMDTLFFYQLLGYGYGKEGLESVKKEFSNFDRKYWKKFYSGKTEFKKGDEITGTVKNYFTLPATVYSPIAVSWAKLDGFQNVFTITIRLKRIENIATLPISPDSP